MRAAVQHLNIYPAAWSRAPALPLPQPCPALIAIPPLLVLQPACRYLCDTPFPFCWAQLLMYMLMCFQFTLPFLIVTASTSLLVHPMLPALPAGAAAWLGCGGVGWDWAALVMIA